jgi:redox-sensitive bicupin YhaK (pirin superfamily)
MNTTTDRKVTKIVPAISYSHGLGFRAFSIGQHNLGSGIQPFLQLDHYFMTQPTFADHPHQGLSAVTYMFEDSEGTFLNQDSQGDRSSILPGDLYWLQAGSGVTHNETPLEPGKVCHGIQMFVDLPPADKYAPAQAFHLSAGHIPVYTTPEGSRVRVAVGAAHGLVSPLQVSTQIRFLDVMLPANGTIEHDIAVHESAFVFAIQGTGEIDGRAIKAQEAALFNQAGEHIKIKAGVHGMQYILCTS